MSREYLLGKFVTEQFFTECKSVLPEYVKEGDVAVLRLGVGQPLIVACADHDGPVAKRRGVFWFRFGAKEVK